MAHGKQAKRPGVAGVYGDSLLQQRLRGEMVLPGKLPGMRHGAHQQVPGVKAVWRLAPGAETLSRIKLRLDGGDYGVGDLVLHLKHVRKLAVIALGPDVAAGGGVIQLHRDAHAPAAFAHAALDDILRAKLLGDLLDMRRLALVDE